MSERRQHAWCSSRQARVLSLKLLGLEGKGLGFDRKARIARGLLADAESSRRECVGSGPAPPIPQRLTPEPPTAFGFRLLLAVESAGENQTCKSCCLSLNDGSQLRKNQDSVKRCDFEVCYLKVSHKQN